MKIWAGGALILVLATSAQAAIESLQGRLPATMGGTDWQAYYDPNLNITWAKDAQLAGFDTWDSQMAWVGNLSLGGVTGWRLPSSDVNGDGTVVDCFGGGVASCADNEMGFLYWEEDITPTTSGPFMNVLSAGYWSGTDLLPPADVAWALVFFNGSRGAFTKFTTFLAWPVYDGDVNAVPVPAAAWLFASALGVFGVLQKRKTKA